MLSKAWAGVKRAWKWVKANPWKVATLGLGSALAFLIARGGSTWVRPDRSEVDKADARAREAAATARTAEEAENHAQEERLQALEAIERRARSVRGGRAALGERLTGDGPRGRPS